MADQYINKQTILNRMSRLAADYYEISRAELLDPVVGLCLESLGEEIYKISGDIDNMEKRILDKLSSMLISDIELITKPSHGIIQVSALEEELILTTETSFSCNYNIDKTEDRLSFYPVCNTKIYNGDIRYFIYNGLFYSVDRERNKTLLTRSRQKDVFSENSFWIGLELDENINNIENLSFYVDFGGVYNKEQYLKQIPHLVFEISCMRIPMRRGIFAIDDTEDNKQLNLFGTFDVSSRINNDIRKEYDPCFLTVKGSFDISNVRESFPAKLVDSFTDSFKEDFTKPLLWIEVSCPSQYTNDIISSLQISINTVPVVCKKLISQTLEINRSVPVIPLYTDKNESFLSVHSISDSTGKEYYDIPVNDTEKDRYGIYSLRQGGCERYNIRDARDYLSYTADSLDSEASALSKSKKELKTELKKIQSDLQIVVKGLKQALRKEKDCFETINYILLNPEKSDEIYFVKYWVANFISGHKIRSGTSLRTESELAVKPSTIFFLAATKEGSYAPQQSDRAGIFRKSMTKRPLLVTDEDIIEFCKEEFCDLVKEVSVSKGFIDSNDPKTGFIGTTDVHIVSEEKNESPIGKEDAEYFRQILAENSPATFNYRILIN
ncbi:hypothetical protein M2451_003980 [Dysgonomonas sp. PFB1-18]|uniref:hypothetical protein n=1 Tax=unclassified Dysgonomonas TaxID=2630389 RepID=UPI002476B45A|nr:MULTISPECIES: hypothetical protein [unclassified Dysgonomonas]MDH6311106.1 hypothetical protein [Dysgonomonas sp. PF1-14]MDH6340976.1 hypothetical protein [Dysgonomonas sp. PF1-16]MDH6382635.1 hypothetical protein [Dysgonomonas sp. PFB1-18]MDH6399982.1 hypothetical protein [Dysgonomonas sp. PF1-23]